jgi:hypothetical protein
MHILQAGMTSLETSCPTNGSLHDDLVSSNADSADDDQVVPDLIKATKKLFKLKAKAKRRKALLSKLAKPRPPKKA